MKLLIFVSIICFLYIFQNAQSVPIEDFYRNINIHHVLNYDFVIVGAGSAGSVVANKLSANRNFTVLLIEEGGYSTDIYRARDTFQYSENFILFPDREITKIFNNAPYSQTGNRNNVESLRGKVAGGCNAINAMVASVGNSYDYDEWASLSGEPMWAWNASVQPTHLPDIFSQMSLKFNRDSDSINKEIGQSLKNLGYDHFDDLYGGTNYGYTLAAALQKLGDDGLYHRITSFSQYVDTVSRVRPNLSILVKHKVLRIDFDKTVSPVRAKGVYLKDLSTNQYVYIEINKELVLSAGAYDSPLLLQFSGVGDPTHLNKFGIETVVNSPYVGKHLVDHIVLFVLGRQVNLPFTRVFKPDDSPYNGHRLFGPKSSDKKVKWVTSIGVIKMPLIFGVNYFCAVEMVAPTSVGYLELEKLTNNNESFELPLLRTNHLSDPVEMDYMVQGIKACQNVENQLVTMGVVSPLGINLGHIRYIMNSLESDFTLRQTIKESFNTAFHPHGTLKMGKDDDITSPTTGKLRLKGTSNVRIIDASVIPVSPSGNTNLPSIIVGLQGAQFILNDHQ